MFLIRTIVDIELNRGFFRSHVAVEGWRVKMSSAGRGLGKIVDLQGNLVLPDRVVGRHTPQ
jgi:hypothetical protein